MRPNARVATVLLAPLTLVLLGTIVIPIGIFFVYSFYRFELLEPIPGFHLDNYTSALTDPLYRELASNTIAIAVPTTIVSVALGYLVAYYLAFDARRSRNPILALIVISMMASYLARVYAWRTLLGEQGIVNASLKAIGLIHHPLEFLLFSRFAVVVAQVNLFLPFAALLLYASLIGVPHQLHEGARDLGAGPVQTFRRITLPLSGHALLAATVLTFFFSAGDYITPVLLGGVNSSTFGTAISDQLRITGDYPLGAALSFVMLMAFAVLYVALRGVLTAAHLLPNTRGRGT